MARTTTSAVLEILLKDYDTVNEPDLQGFIDSAAVVVARVQQCAIRKGITLTCEELELLERWLASHLYVQSDATYSARQTLRASGSFNKDKDSYLRAAELIDPSGCLENIINNARLRMVWLGKRPSQKRSVHDRQ